jgi:hypothetical protein
MSPHNDDTESSDNVADRLRIISILIFIPALGLNISLLRDYNYTIPIFGLIPSACSVILAVCELNIPHIQKYERILLRDDSPEPKSWAFRKAIVAIIDLLIASAFLGVITASFIRMLRTDYGWTRGNRVIYGIVLGTFATVPYFANL